MFNEELEFEGDTLEEAVKKAVQRTGIAKNRLEIKVVCEEKRGLFGMAGAKSAKIKVKVRK